MGGKALERLEARIASLHKSGGTAAAEAELDRLRARMHDLSQFVKTFKEAFGLAAGRNDEVFRKLWKDGLESGIF